MRKKTIPRYLSMAAALLLALAGCGLSPSTSRVPDIEPGSLTPIDGAEGTRITVGSKNFTEQLILGKIGVLVAKSSGFKVTDMTSIPGSQPARRLLVEGEVNMMWEYTGTAWLTYMGHEEGISDQREQWQVVRDADEPNGLTWGQPGPLNNTYAFAVRSEYARQRGLTKLSDIANLPPEERTLCVESEFNSRRDGLTPLLQTYGIPKGDPAGIPRANISVMDTGTIYTATDQGSCNFGEVFTTDGRIDSLDLTVLEDDRGFFPSYNISPVFDAELVQEFPELQERYEAVNAELTDSEMRSLNYKVDVEGRDPADVAHEWMVDKGFLSE
ncbi:MAG: glycine betaine ABC transporter substrate-binding protein [Actinomycetaceae bacterium]|nr:glycine betaine ABC transporter substrate-binding protein [Actinomycetaceae bacterium]